MFTSSALSSRSGISLDDIDAPWLDDLPRQPDGTVAAMDVWRALDAIDTSRFADAEHLELVELWRRIGSACAARRLHHMAEFATTPVMGRGSDGQVREHADDELALRTRCARRKTSHELATALMLRDVLPGTRAALARGVIDVPRAAAIADACLPLGPTAALRVELEVLARAAFQDPRAVARASARAVMVIDAASIETRRKAAPKTRYVSGQPAPDGMADMFAHLPAMDWVVISSAINAAARAVKATGDSRTLEQLRVDALVAPFAKALRTGILDGLDPITLARHRGIRPSVHVHVTAEALLGLSRTPADLAGYGPITADMARELATDGTWNRLLTDPASGALIDVGTTTYSPPASMARWVEARDRTCRFPGCRVAAERCDLDHVTPYPAGATSVDNLQALCRRHHRLKHDLPGTRVARATDGTLTWTMPTGQHYMGVVEGLASGDSGEPPPGPAPPSG